MAAAVAASLAAVAIVSPVASADAASKTFRPMANLADADVPPCSPGFHVDVFIPPDVQEPISHEFVDGAGQPMGAPCPSANVNVTKYEPGQQPPGATNPEWQTKKSYRVTITSSDSSKPQPRDFGVKVSWQTADAGGESGGTDPDDIGGQGTQGEPRLVVEKTRLIDGPVAAGSTVPFRVRVTNVGDAVAPDVDVLDWSFFKWLHVRVFSDPVEVDEILEARAPRGRHRFTDIPPDPCRINPFFNPYLRCEVGDMAPGAFFEVTYSMRIPDVAELPGLLRPTGTLSGHDVPVTPFLDNRTEARSLGELADEDVVLTRIDTVISAPDLWTAPNPGGNVVMGGPEDELVQSDDPGGKSKHKATASTGEGGADVGVGSDRPDLQTGDSLTGDADGIESVIEDLQTIVVQARQRAGTPGGARASAYEPRGRPGNDRLFGGAGPDLQHGGPGSDTLGPGPGDDLAYGGSGRDAIDGGDGNDVVDGDGTNSPTLKQIARWSKRAGLGLRVKRRSRSRRVRADDDRLHGGAGNDVLRGGGGRDRLVGGRGRDKLYGDGGDDRIDARDGGPGDKVVCGRGRDRVLADRHDKVLRKGRNRCERVRRTKRRR